MNPKQIKDAYAKNKGDGINKKKLAEMEKSRKRIGMEMEKKKRKANYK